MIEIFVGQTVNIFAKIKDDLDNVITNPAYVTGENFDIPLGDYISGAAGSDTLHYLVTGVSPGEEPLNFTCQRIAATPFQPEVELAVSLQVRVKDAIELRAYWQSEIDEQGVWVTQAGPVVMSSGFCGQVLLASPYRLVLDAYDANGTLIESGLTPSLITAHAAASADPTIVNVQAVGNNITSCPRLVPVTTGRTTITFTALNVGGQEISGSIAVRVAGITSGELVVVPA